MLVLLVTTKSFVIMTVYLFIVFTVFWSITGAIPFAHIDFNNDDDGFLNIPEFNEPDNYWEVQEEKASFEMPTSDLLSDNDTCDCQEEVKTALILAIENCINILKIKESCHSQKKCNSEVVQAMSSCECSSKVNVALAISLKRCANTIEHSLICKQPKYTLKGNFSSCAAIKQDSPYSKSGFYNLTINGKNVSIYCNMDTLCNSDKGWTRVGFLDMTDNLAVARCPDGLTQYNISAFKICGLTTGPGCVSINIPSYNIKYSQVCGRVRGYQRHMTDAFHTGGGINDHYIDGISITHGSPRKHIWSLASGFSEQDTRNDGCPCNHDVSKGALPPSFVGKHYYCESGIKSGTADRFFTEDPLWDGKQCGGREEPCCPGSSLLPWFHRNITATTDPIEFRMCITEGIDDENFGIDQYELYVE